MFARTLPRPRAEEASPLWPLAVFVCAVALFWHDTLLAQLAHTPELAPRHVPPRLAASFGVFTQLAFSALEAFLYARAWRAAGRTLPWARTAATLFVISALEAFAVFLLQRPDAARFAWLVGPRAAWPGGIAASALARAFGGAGALAFARIALTARAQAGAAGARFAAALALVLAGWLGSRLVLWWTLDLVRGFAPGS
jgi:hypothetical protein